MILSGILSEMRKIQNVFVWMAVLVCIGLAVHEFWVYADSAGTEELLLGIFSVAVAGVLVFYAVFVLPQQGKLPRNGNGEFLS